MVGPVELPRAAETEMIRRQTVNSTRKGESIGLPLFVWGSILPTPLESRANQIVTKGAFRARLDHDAETSSPLGRIRRPVVRIPLPPSPVGHISRADRVDASCQQETNRHDGQKEHPDDPDTLARAGCHDLNPTRPFGLRSPADPPVTSFFAHLRLPWLHQSRLSWQRLLPS